MYDRNKMAWLDALHSALQRLSFSITKHDSHSPLPREIFTLRICGRLAFCITTPSILHYQAHFLFSITTLKIYITNLLKISTTT